MVYPIHPQTTAPSQPTNPFLVSQYTSPSYVCAMADFTFKITHPFIVLHNRNIALYWQYRKAVLLHYDIHTADIVTLSDCKTESAIVQPGSFPLQAMNARADAEPLRKKNEQPKSVIPAR